MCCVHQLIFHENCREIFVEGFISSGNGFTIYFNCLLDPFTFHHTTKGANILLRLWSVYLASSIDLNMELTGLHKCNPKRNINDWIKISVGIKDCSSSLTWSIKLEWFTDWICTCSFKSQAFLPPKPQQADLHGGSISDWEISSSLSGSSWGAGTKIILSVEIMVHNLGKWLTGRIWALSLTWSLRHSRGKYFNFERVF